MYIDGDHTPHESSPPTKIEAVLEAFCLTGGTVAARLASIPNEPVHFLAEQPPRARSEDAEIAYTWMHFIQNSKEPDWLLRYVT